MGVIKQGILGAFSGKVGSVIGGSWKGIAYMRSRPASVANPKTAGQVNQRSSFKQTILLGSMLLTAICKPLWDRFAQEESGYNAFTSANIKTFVNGVFTNFSDFIISRGKLVGFAEPSFIAAVASDTVTIEWTDNSGEGDALATDKAYMAVYNETQEIWAWTVINESRSTENASATFAADMEASDVIHVYFGYRRLDGTSVSDSQYLTGSVPV